MQGNHNLYSTKTTATPTPTAKALDYCSAEYRAWYLRNWSQVLFNRKPILFECFDDSVVLQCGRRSNPIKAKEIRKGIDTAIVNHSKCVWGARILKIYHNDLHIL
ncbi:hypothetical protein CEXT_529831 [Caerostris extrusa]|uniref:Uncharacterized protein n=1 Tax=Caerostris extrusa TaxID=172846 RepID=A0AAV4QBS9_CAEEX|nr:hypothetical protein CEXT_529831 [Caerostris extrusa]